MSKQSAFVPNSFQTPNGYVDQFMTLLTGEEYKVLIYATRRILGFQKRQDRISISQFTDGTRSKDGEVLDSGTGLSIETVKKCLGNLVGFGLMVRMEENDPRTNEGVLWSLQWDESQINWQALEEREAKKAKVDTEKMAKARSMRQAHPLAQTPANGIERTPLSPTDPPSPYGIETQKTDEIQRKPEGAIPALDFRNMTVGQARKVPAIKLYIEATEQFPASVLWETVHNTITEKALTFEQLRSAAVAWIGKGYRPENVTGILEWAENGIPASANGPKSGPETRPAVNDAAVEATKKLLSDKYDGQKFSPPPAGLRPNLQVKKLAEQKGVRK
jgi:hypothetical protein